MFLQGCLCIEGGVRASVGRPRFPRVDPLMTLIWDRGLRGPCLRSLLQASGSSELASWFQEDLGCLGCLGCLNPKPGGMFPLILTVLSRDYSTPYYSPYSGL